MASERTLKHKAERKRIRILTCKTHGTHTTWVKHGDDLACMRCAITAGLVKDKRWGL